MFNHLRRGINRFPSSPVFQFQRATLVTSRELRNQFLSYFESKGHIIVPGSSVIPEDDPSLLFVNAGMNQFKKYYLGEVVPKQRKLTTSQLCIRAGGKHNDLDNIGFTPRHQTMFEMLGNFSLGAYFKEEAISMAYEFVTKEIGINHDYLRVSVHEKDDTARELWKKIGGFTDAQIVNRGDKDNFWSMGSDDSPSGFCSEIFYTTNPTSQYDDWLEIWNIVFMNTKNQGGWIDTGMGCERMLSVLNGVPSNFDTDIFTPLIHSIHARFPSLPEAQQHIFADHLRSSVVLANEVFPSSKGRGYVLRKIIRRMLRYAYTSGITEPFLSLFVPEIIQQMQEQIPTLPANSAKIQQILRNEEEFFWRAVTDGKKSLTAKLRRKGETPSVATLQRFRADTGLPIDMIVTLLEEREIPYDREAVQNWMASDTREGEGVSMQKTGIPEFGDISEIAQKQSLDPSIYSFDVPPMKTRVLSAGEVGGKDGLTYVVLQNCPYFPTQAGQDGDRGYLEFSGASYPVVNTRQIKCQNVVVCMVRGVGGKLKAGDEVMCGVDLDHRGLVAAHHTATHLLHSLLARESFGGKSESGGKSENGGKSSNETPRQSLQTGSHITSESFTFDFYAGFLNDQLTNNSRQFLQHLEDSMNALAQADIKVVRTDFSRQQIREMPKNTFIGDVSRIARHDDVFHTISAGEGCREFCCGQHVTSTRSIYPFIITGVQSVSAGIKRIEGRAGNASLSTLLKERHALQEASEALGVSEKEVVGKLAGMKKEEEALRLSNVALMRSVLEVIQPSYCVEVGGKPVRVFELAGDLGKEFREKLFAKMKSDLDSSSCLILEQKSFTLLLQNGVSDVDGNRLKDVIFKIGGGGKGGGKKGIIKGVCNGSLMGKKEIFKDSHFLPVCFTKLSEMLNACF